MELTREQALALLRQYNEEPFTCAMPLTVEAVMTWFAGSWVTGRRRRSGPKRGCCTTWTSSATRRSTASRCVRSWSPRAGLGPHPRGSQPRWGMTEATPSRSTKWSGCSSPWTNSPD